MLKTFHYQEAMQEISSLFYKHAVVAKEAKMRTTTANFIEYSKIINNSSKIETRELPNLKQMSSSTIL